MISGGQMRTWGGVQGQPEVLEVEVDTEGKWRYTGCASAPWYDINVDPASVKPLAPPPAPGFEDAEVSGPWPASSLCLSCFRRSI